MINSERGGAAGASSQEGGRKASVAAAAPIGIANHAQATLEAGTITSAILRLLHHLCRRICRY
jgi:hypothetical protein